MFLCGFTVDWVIRPAEGAKLISNAVTDEANERPKYYATETYLEAKNSKDGEYNLQMMVRVQCSKLKAYRCRVVADSESDTL